MKLRRINGNRNLRPSHGTRRAQLRKGRRPHSPLRSRSNPNLKRPIEELKLIGQAYRALKAAGINAIGELVTQTDADLSDLRHFGPKCLDDVKEKLAKWRLRLGMKISQPGQA